MSDASEFKARVNHFNWQPRGSDYVKPKPRLTSKSPECRRKIEDIMEDRKLNEDFEL